MKKFWPVLACAALLVAGCAGGRREEEATKFSRTVSVKVTKAGEVFYNQRAVSPDELGKELEGLPRESTVVCYHREEMDREPHPVAEEVIKKIIEVGVAVRLSEKECP